MMAHPGCRIRTVRDKKTGFTLHVLRSEADSSRIAFLRDARTLVDKFRDGAGSIAGFAVVLWDAELQSNAMLRASERSQIPSIAMPEFIKNRLLTAKIEEWLA